MPFEKPAVAVVGAVGEADDAEDALDLRLAALRRQPGELRVEHQDLAGRQPRLVAEQLGQVADPPARLAVADRPAQHLAVARGRPREAEQQLHRGRLAGAVGPEEAEHLAAPRRGGRATRARRSWP